MPFLKTFKSFRVVWLWNVVVFLLSGLIINCIQILILPLWYISRNTFRQVNAVLCSLHWSFLTVLGEWWGHLEIKFYGKKEDYEKIGKEHAIVLPNHRSDIDWLIGLILGERTSMSGATKCYMKKSLRYLPVIGWMWWCAEYVFLRRSWASDQPVLKKSLQQLKDFPIPFLLCIFPEGTRFTEAKHQNSLEFARSRGLPEYNYHLFPRTKGVTLTLESLKDVVPAVYDVEAAYAEGSIHTIQHLMSGGRCEVHLLIRRIPMEDIPCTSEEEASVWCQKLFAQKDKAMTDFVNNGAYLADRVDLPRKKTNLVIFLFWNIVMVVPLLWGVSSLLRTGILVSLLTVAVLLLTAYVAIRILIHCTDSGKGSKFGLQRKRSEEEPRREVQNGKYKKTN